MDSTHIAIAKPDYGVDAPKVMRNMFLFGGLSLVLFFVSPRVFHIGPVALQLHGMFGGLGVFLLAEGFLFLLYVKFGKFRHRDFMLSMHAWRGDEKVLDVGCGRGLLLAGVAKRLISGHAMGIDIWSNEDMGGNSAEATQRNLEIEGVASVCTLVGASAQKMQFPDASFDLVVSNLCLHNIYDKVTRGHALAEIARVLKPGGLALLSDYKLTGEYAAALREMGFGVEMRWGSFATTFPPLRVVIARKPA